MFVTGLLNDWKRKLEEGRRRHSNGRHDYETFLANQRRIWTPPELFEKCCPRWLAGGDNTITICHRRLDDQQSNRQRHQQHQHQHQQHTGGTICSSVSDEDSYVDCNSFVRLKNGNWTCPGGCNKVHPTITLYFERCVRGITARTDGKKYDRTSNKRNHRTIAILSSRLDPFTSYFDSRVNDGSAVCKTPFYYELDGFLRENLYLLRHQQHFGSHLVDVAMGALKESDFIQRQLLEEEYCSSRLHRTTQTYDRLEEVMEICRQHRLAEDLDVLSIYCMQRTSRTFRSVANRMAADRMRHCQLVVSPLLDGYYIAGYSVFRRSDPDRPTVLEREHGRMVEYAVGPQIMLHQNETDCGKFAPERRNCTSTSDGSSEDRSINDTFSWACEELSFANLEREWGDIGVHEYVGQKVLVQWQRTEVDMVENGTDQSSSSSPSSSQPELTIHDLGITFRGHSRQRAFPLSYTSPMFSFHLVVDRMEATQVDDVTIRFRGSANIVSCEIDFRYLVAQYARSLEPYLRVKHQQIERTRPLLRKELAFMTELRDVMYLR